MNRLLLTTSLFLLAAPLAFAQASETQPPETPAVYTPTSLAAEPGLPRTRSGHPDFQGVVWATNFFPVFESSPMLKTLVVSEAESKAFVDKMVSGIMSNPAFNIDPEGDVIIGGTDGLPLVRGERRSRLVVLPPDGKVPLTPEAKKIASVSTDEKNDYEQRPSGERCLVLSGAPPNFLIVSYNRLQFIQTTDHIVIHGENGDEARIIPFATAHAPTGPDTWYGDSIARWDGDTLVVETIRQRQGEAVRGLFQKFLVNADAKVIERFTRITKDEMLYQFTVEDPKAYTAPWLAEYSFHASTTGMFPSPCHEHNYSLPNILLGQRVADMKGLRQD